MTDTDPGADTIDVYPSSKVARLIDKYNLGDTFGAHLEALWTNETDKRMSLRDLADLFNQHLLNVALERVGTPTIDGEVENFYRLLTANDVSRGMNTEACARLERSGVDVDQLKQDFVTYQAIRSYLTEYRDAEYVETTSGDRISKVDDTIQRLQSRTRSVSERSLEQLCDTNRLTLGEFRLFVDINILCEDCGAQYGVKELLDRGGCDCEQSE